MTQEITVQASEGNVFANLGLENSNELLVKIAARYIGSSTHTVSMSGLLSRSTTKSRTEERENRLAFASATYSAMM